jgi:hypothetical protein
MANLSTLLWVIQLRIQLYTECMLHWVIRLHPFQIHSCIHTVYINQSGLVLHQRKNRRVNVGVSGFLTGCFPHKNQSKNWVWPGATVLKQIKEPVKEPTLDWQFVVGSLKMFKRIRNQFQWLIFCGMCLIPWNRGVCWIWTFGGKHRTGGYNKIKEPPNTGWFTRRYQRNEDG